MYSIQLLSRESDTREVIEVTGDLVLAEDRVRQIAKLFRVAGQTVEIQEGDDLVLLFPDGSTLRLKKWFPILAELGDQAPELADLQDAGADVESVQFSDDFSNDEDLEEIEAENEERDFDSDEFQAETFSPLPALVDPGLPELQVAEVVDVIPQVDEPDDPEPRKPGPSDPVTPVVDPPGPEENGVNERPILDLNSLTGEEDPAFIVSDDPATNTEFEDEEFLSKDPNNEGGNEFNLVEGNPTPSDPRAANDDAVAPVATGQASVSDPDSLNPSFGRLTFRLVDPNDPAFTDSNSFATRTDPDADPLTENDVLTNFDNSSLTPLDGMLTEFFDQELFVLGESVGGLSILEINRDPLGGGVFEAVTGPLRFSLAGARDSNSDGAADDDGTIFETAEIRLQAPGVLNAQSEITQIKFEGVDPSTLDGLHFTLSESDGAGGVRSRSFWFEVDGSGTPAPGANPVETMIAITSALTPAEIAAEVQAAVNGELQFSATISGTTVSASSAAATNLDDGTASSAGASGVDVVVTQQGQDATPEIRVEIDPINHTLSFLGGGGALINKEVVDLLLRNFSLQIESTNGNGSNFTGAIIPGGAIVPGIVEAADFNHPLQTETVNHPFLTEGTLGRLVQVTVVDNALAENGDRSFPLTSHPAFAGIAAEDRPFLDLNAADNSMVNIPFLFGAADTATLSGLSAADLLDDHRLVFGDHDSDAGAITPETFYRTLKAGGSGEQNLVGEGAGASLSNMPSVTDLDTEIAQLDATLHALADSTIEGVDHSDTESLTIHGDGAVDVVLPRGSTVPAAVTVGGIQFDITSADGLTFTITPNGGGTQPLAAWDALLAAFEYGNTSTLPAPGNKDITFQVTDAGGLQSNQAIWTIDQKAQIGIDVQNGVFSLTEESGQFSIDIVLNESLAETITVDVTVMAGTAEGAGTDFTFTPVTQTITFVPGDTLETISIAIDDDSIVESSETLTVTLSNPTVNGVAVGPTDSVELADDDGGLQNSTVLTITETDTANWSITGDASVAEGASAAYSLALSGTFQNGQMANVDLNLNDVTTSSADYASFLAAVDTAIAAYGGAGTVSRAGNTITFNNDSGGNASMTALGISLAAVADGVVEGSENFTLDLTSAASASGANVGIGTAQAATTITEADSASWSITGDASVAEGASATYSLALSGTFQNGEMANVDLNLNNVTTTGADYASFLAAVDTAIAAYAGAGTVSRAGNTITFNNDSGGNASMTALGISLAATADSVVEGSENFTLDLTSAGSTSGASVGIGTAQAATTITEADSANWSITGDAAVAEGASATYSLALSGTFQNGEMANVDLNLNNVTTTGADYASFLAVVDTAIAAYAGAGTVSRAGNTITFNNDSGGNASMTALGISLAATADSVVEGSENFTLDLTSAGSTSGATVGIGTAQAATTITEADSANWSITGDAAVAEGASATYSLALSGTFQNGEMANVDLNLNNVTTTGADYASFLAAVDTAIAAYGGAGTVSRAGNTITFNNDSGGNASMTALGISLAAATDGVVEGSENFTLDLTSAGSASGASVGIGTAQAATTITEADSASWSITGDAAVAEGASATYSLALSGIFQNGEMANVDLDLNNVTTSGADYASFLAAVDTAIAAYGGAGTVSRAGNTITFNNDSGGNASMTALAISLAAATDGVVEGSENFTLDLTSAGSASGASVGIGAAQAVTTITDGDSGAWSLSGPSNAMEGTTATYIVSLSGTFADGQSASVDVLTDTAGPGLSAEPVDIGAIMTVIGGRTDITFDGTTLTYTNNTGGNASMAPVSFTVDIVSGDGSEGSEVFEVRMDNESANTTLGLSSILTTIDPSATPVIIDLDGDGVEFIGLDQSDVQFDIDGDGALETVAWAGADDGFLAYDQNGDGKVTEHSEIVLTEHAPGASTDLEALRIAFDTNEDDVFDSLDEAWNSFGVWRDANSNGFSDIGEFQSLNSLGITSIDLVSDGMASSPAQGVHVFGTTEVTFADGSTADAADAALSSSEILTEEDDSVESLLPDSNSSAEAVQTSNGGGGATEGAKAAPAIAAAPVDDEVTAPADAPPAVVA